MKIPTTTYATLTLLILGCIWVPLVHADTLNTCTSPVTYSIDSIDTRFGLSRSEFLQDLSVAESVWEVPAKRSLFTYQETGGEVKVSLVYDSRQESADKLKATNKRLETIKTAFDALSTQYDRIALDTKAEQSKNVADIAVYKQQESAFNSSVEAANARGGATPTELADFQTHTTILTDTFTRLHANEVRMNEKIRALNSIAGLLLQLATVLNSYVAQYNTAINATPAFEEGVYTSAGNDQSIRVYEYLDRTQLTRVLAHEMGHALGLDHVADSTAIMYKVNKGTNLSATSADLTELQKACGILAL